MVEEVRIAVLDSHDTVLTKMDNTAPKALHYYDDELHEYLKGSAYTYKFSCSAKHADSQYIVEGNKIAFREAEKQRDYYLNIMHVEKDEYEVRAECYGLLFELLNEDVGPYAASSAMSFAQYWAAFDPEGSTTLGLNEVSDKKITHEWTGTETLLARLYSLATVFDAEIEFVAELNDDCSLKRIAANVYREHSDDYQGMGQERTDMTLRYGREVTGITKTSDITKLYTAIRPTGKDGLKITNLVKTEYDENGNVEFQSPSGDDSIRAVQARDRFPSNLTREYDGYIMRVWSYDTDNVEMLYGQALAKLKKISEPQVSYEVDGYVDAGIGDTVEIVDEEYNPVLYLSARITEQVRSFTDPDRFKTTFDNFEEMQSQIDPALLARVTELVDAAKPKTFQTRPEPPYHVGDIWFTGTEIKVCVAGRESGEFSALDWEKKDAYVDDTSIEEFLQDYQEQMEEIRESIDKKSETWFQDTDPSLKWTGTEVSPLQDIDGEDILDTAEDTIATVWEKEKYAHENDLWKNSDTNVEYIYQDGLWVEIPLPDAIFDEIDGKAQIFVTQPTPPYAVGDMWLNGTDADIMTCITPRAEGNFVAEDWQKRNKYTDDTKANEAQNTANAKKRVFLTTPTPPYDVGDLWCQGDTGDILRCVVARETGEYNASDWELASKYTDDSAVTDLDQSLNQQGIFNRLTKNGQAQGIFLDGDDLYINGTYVEFDGATIGGWLVTGTTLRTKENDKLILDGENGIIYTERQNGNKGAEFFDDGIRFYSWEDDGNYIGKIGSGIYTDENRHVLNLIADSGDALFLGCSDVGGLLYVAVSNVASSYGRWDKGVTIGADLRVLGEVKFGPVSNGNKYRIYIANNGLVFDAQDRLFLPDNTLVGGYGVVRAASANTIRLQWTGSQLDLWVDTTRIGKVVTA